MVDASTAVVSASGNNAEDGNAGDVTHSFRQKVDYMKTWKPASTPSNRDRLELYALHKQAISGNAPSTMVSQTAADRAKYQAWRSKSGLVPQEAMRAYITESDRQVRVYGLAASLPETQETQVMQQQQTPLTQQQRTPQNTPAIGASSTSSQQQGRQPRGLAAIPLLCAAASESRQAYVRRLGNTPEDQGWWSRQEPLCGTPGTVWGFPEHVLLWTAALQERIALKTVDDETSPAGYYFPFVPISVLQSFLWPFHNCLLAAWMGMVLTLTGWAASAELIQTVLWGSRRTGLSLGGIWKDQVVWSSQVTSQLTEPHQAMAARLVGLALTPLQLVVYVSGHLVPGGLVWTGLAYAALLLGTWWYWWIVSPWMCLCLLTLALTTAGPCFAVIEMASL